MQTTLKLACSLLIGCMSLFVQAQDRDISKLSSGGKLNPLQANMDIRHYTLSLNIDISKESIKGFADVDVSLARTADTLLVDLINLYKVSSIAVNSKEQKFSHIDNKLDIYGDKQYPQGIVTIRVNYSGQPPVAVRPPWSGGFTWTKDRSGNPWIAINCQKEGGRVYFPCKDHPSDEPNEGVDMHITVPDTLVVSGPGLLQKITKRKKTATYHWKTNYTISNYCVLFNIGKYKVVQKDFTTINNNVVPIVFYVLEEDVKEADKLIALKARDTHILEKYFGEYPWVKEKIGICEVPNSGMEHQTMITFDNKFKYQNIGGQEYSDNLFHEYAHEWWANKVTNKDWAHMWIQEGIGTYAEALAYYDLGGEEAYHAKMAAFKKSIKYKKPMVGGEELSEDETYAGNDIYTKGAFFMHSLRYVIGDQIFFPTLKKLATDPQYTYDNFVTSKEVEELFTNAVGYSLKPFFDFYLRTTSTLDFNVKEIGYQLYQITPVNYVMDLPLDIMVNHTIEKKTLTKEGLKITSQHPPIIDPKGFYLKKVFVQ